MKMYKNVTEINGELLVNFVLQNSYTLRLDPETYGSHFKHCNLYYKNRIHKNYLYYERT